MSDYPPTRVDRHRRLLSDKIGSCAQCRSSPGPPWGCLVSEFPARPLHPLSLQNDSTLLPCPHLDAWSHTRRRDSAAAGRAQCAGAVASAAAREHRSALRKGSSDSAFITAQSNKTVA